MNEGAKMPDHDNEPELLVPVRILRALYAICAAIEYAADNDQWPVDTATVEGAGELATGLHTALLDAGFDPDNEGG